MQERVELSMIKMFVFCLAFYASLEACTAFQLKSQDGAVIYCRSLEFGFPLNSDLLIVPRGTTFTGTAPGAQPGLKWSVKYGYIGMNQSLYPTTVSDGMNEKGASSNKLRQEFSWLKTRLPTLWTTSYFVSTVGSAPLSVVKQCIEN